MAATIKMKRKSYVTYKWAVTDKRSGKFARNLDGQLAIYPFREQAQDECAGGQIVRIVRLAVRL